MTLPILASPIFVAQSHLNGIVWTILVNDRWFCICYSINWVRCLKHGSLKIYVSKLFVRQMWRTWHRQLIDPLENVSIMLCILGNFRRCVTRSSVLPIRWRWDQLAHKRSKTNTKGRELMRTNLLGSRSDPAFWTDSSVCLSYGLEIIVKLKLCWVRT